MSRTCVWSLLFAIGLAGGFIDSAAAEDAPFYKGKQINLDIGFNPGGGYDVYARILMRHFTHHLPGEPTVVMRNMPGGGSLIAANHLYNLAPKDGTELGLFAGSVATETSQGLEDRPAWGQRHGHAATSDMAWKPVIGSP